MIYLIGGTGYVGRAYQRLLEARGIPFKVLRRQDVDYADSRKLLRALGEDRPDFVINVAGYVGKPNVDACEMDKADCLFGNAVLPGRIAEACEQAGVPWGHVSSGCIYEGTREDGGGFTEGDRPNFDFRHGNGSFYSGTKALGEEILGQRDGMYVWRMRMPFNHLDGPRNYLSKLMRYDRLLDGVNSLSHLDEFITATLACWEKRVPWGTYNVTNPGAISTREVVGLILESGVCRREFRFFADEDEFMQCAAVARRSNCVLSVEKLAAAGIRLAPVHEAVRIALGDWRPG